MPRPDVLIRGGLIIDGSGSEGFYGTVAITGDSIELLRGRVDEIEAGSVVDATGHVVCPGFIDFHAHSGIMILDFPRHEPKVSQGVTTEVIGVDGNSYAPFRRHGDLMDFVEINSGLDGAPAFEPTWSSVHEYLNEFDRRVAVNIAYVVGNSPLRISAIGWENRPATPVELSDMKAMLREAMQDGAWGMSTGLDYPPGEFADTEELTSLCEVVSELGGIYHTHTRNKLGDRFTDPVREAIKICGRAELPCHITHLYKRASGWTFKGGSVDLLRLLEDARTDDIDVTFDTYPYTLSSSRLLVIFPSWTLERGPAGLKEILRSKEGRERLRRELQPRATSWQEMWLTYFKTPANKNLEGLSVSEAAVIRGVDEVDLLCSLLLEEDLQVSYVAHGALGLTRWQFLVHPLAMVGSDALLLGDYPSPRTYGTFVTVVGDFVRDDGVLSLPDAIRKMTSFPAQRLGLPDRGLLRDGTKADVVVFDPETVKSNATRRQPRQMPLGVSHVFVNGEPVIVDGQHTGKLPGRALRRGRPERLR